MCERLWPGRTPLGARAAEQGASHARAERVETGKHVGNKQHGMLFGPDDGVHSDVLVHLDAEVAVDFFYPALLLFLAIWFFCCLWCT